MSERAVKKSASAPKAPAKVARKTATKTAAKSARKTAKSAARSPAKAGPAKKSTPRKATKSAPKKVAKSARKSVPAPPVDPAKEPPPTPVLSVQELRELGSKLTPDGQVDPPQLVWELRMRGYTWEQAARAAGYDSAARAQLAGETYVKRAVLETAPSRRAEALNLADFRLNAIIGIWWERARRDPQAAQILLAAMRDYAKVWRINEPEAAAQMQRVIVIAGSEEEYLEGLQIAVADRQARAKKPQIVDMPPPGPAELEA